MRVLFAGSPSVAIPTLDALYQSEHDVVHVLSQPDRPMGRQRIIHATPVAVRARELAIELSTPESASDVERVVSDVRPDLAITVAYGRMISPAALALPRLGWWNVHFSLLPRWRGATPVQHALLHGDQQTGVTIFQLDEGLDTGPVLSRAVYPIRADHTAGVLLDELGALGATLLLDTLSAQEAGALTPEKQVGEATYAPKLVRNDGRLDWSAPRDSVLNRFRAVTPEPGAFTTPRGKSETLTIHMLQRAEATVSLDPGQVEKRGQRIFVGCADGALELVQVQPAGKRSMPAVAWWNGAGPEVAFV